MQIQKPKQGYKIIHTKYSGFYEIPNDWNLKKLGEILLLEYGKGLVEDKRTNFGYPVYGSGGLIGNHNKFLTTGPGIVVSRKGSLGNVFFISDNFWAIDTVYYITKDQTIQDLHFLTYFLKHLRLENYAIVTAQPGISREEVYAIHVKVPSLPEQRKIASILSNVDSLIQQAQKIIEQTQKLKKGMMQRLLTKGIGHTKFKLFQIGPRYLKVEIPSEWTIDTLDSILIQSISYGVLVPEEDPNGVPMIRSGEIDSSGGIERNLMYISKKLEEKYRKTRLQGGEILMALVGATIGQLTIAPDRCRGFNVSRALAVIKLLPEHVSEFYAYFLKTNMIQKKIRVFSIGSAQPVINLAEISKFKIPIPKKDEQLKITSILNSLDVKIKKQQEYKSHLETLKKGLMQKLLTGQMRVKA